MKDTKVLTFRILPLTGPWYHPMDILGLMTPCNLFDFWLVIHILMPCPVFFPKHHQLLVPTRLWKTNRLAKIDWNILIIFSIFEHHADNPVIPYHQLIISLLYMAMSFRSIPAPCCCCCFFRRALSVAPQPRLFWSKKFKSCILVFCGLGMGGKNANREKHWMIKLKLFVVGKNNNIYLVEN